MTTNDDFHLEPHAWSVPQASEGFEQHLLAAADTPQHIQPSNIVRFNLPVLLQVAASFLLLATGAMLGASFNEWLDSPVVQTLNSAQPSSYLSTYLEGDGLWDV